MHHITSRGGTTVPVFNQAIPQSPAFFPQFNPYSIALTDRFNDGQLNQQFDSFVNSSQCASSTTATLLDCLKNQTTDILQTANKVEICKAPYGEFQYGPAIDGIFVIDMPGVELLHGNFARGVNLMLGHNRSGNHHVS